MTGSRRGGLAGPVSGGATASRQRRAAGSPAPDPAAPEALLAGGLLDGLAEAVVLTDAAGRVTLLNDAARQLLPEVAIGCQLTMCPVPALARAAEDGSDGFEAEHLGRQLHGRCRPFTDGRSVWYVRDVTEERARTDALLAERSRTAFLAEAGARLSLSLHPEHTLRAAVTLLVPYLADAAVVVRRPTAPLPATGPLSWVRYAAGDGRPVSGTGRAELADSVPGLTEAMSGDPTEASPWLAAQLADLGWALPDDFGPPGTVLVAPMPGAGAGSGALVAIRRAGRPGFDEPDVALVRQFAARAGAALGTAELYGEQAHLARVLQASLLPPALPPIPGVTLAGGYRAAGDSLRIGGDFYDAFPADDGGTFALGDVCGKGVEAAVLSGRVRQSLDTLRLVEDRPLRLLELLNQALFNAPDADRRAQFTTLLLGTLAPATRPGDGLRLRIAGGGHPAPLVAGRDGTVRAVKVGGMPVGALPTARFSEISLRLAPGELLLAYSDGVTEARGGPDGHQMFGEARLAQALAGCAALPPAALIESLLQHVDDWLDGHSHDDIALLALRAGPEWE
ncbi:SpoIIE family protein phosphatase [Solwaraspora sp. WMMD1047]|uniref:GAF domain-containing SpoIIE family protein phosphatase n=1 Tax=Solwaraspora sp. WMMD1047 TaxID=3016102 RepID=UPI002416C038|nr:GAF domain-containing SpoIIE family protein phosphatase [Solwaraspora sp. WMMD1047]MDG4828908.1 SpoIIE family protein phosphatase [Solwaraspora sp. WMMD1047]